MISQIASLKITDFTHEAHSIYLMHVEYKSVVMVVVVALVVTNLCYEAYLPQFVL
jgi:hypothetical protein